ncbi:non-canonical purine NTP diphosphatase [uncultured Bacteroides sp.]|uniref:non-canonical purine NTP diphosphatase n=1 Tax=uncultured Bacteroides sp. TaxID=162156 RepID=UPI002AAB1489|nr:non-canonical purine NTP diphosphatase [uncultured Bacteroides sp.]
MKNKLVFATNNIHKIEEVSSILNDKIELLSLKDIHCNVDIPETANTFEGNALLKAEYIYDNYQLNCFGDDSGLEIEALNNEPGVYSARYAGEDKNSLANMQKVLSVMEGEKNRKAQFRTVISLILNGKKYFFEGTIKGEIITKERGESGFGYDPIFVPEGYNKTFAELGNEVKNKISHRAQAVDKLCKFILSLEK